jgi:hypothetical protein
VREGWQLRKTTTYARTIVFHSVEYVHVRDSAEKWLP